MSWSIKTFHTWYGKVFNQENLNVYCVAWSSELTSIPIEILKSAGSIATVFIN